MAASSRLSGGAKKSPTSKYKYRTQQIQLQILQIQQIQLQIQQIQENKTESGGK